MSFRKRRELGSMRVVGIRLPANGCRVTLLVAASVVVVQGSKITRRSPALVSVREKLPSRSKSVGSVITFVYGCRLFHFSKVTNVNSLFLTIGAPSVPPPTWL